MLSRDFITGTAFGVGLGLLLSAAASHWWHTSTYSPQHDAIHHVKVTGSISLSGPTLMDDIEAAAPDDAIGEEHNVEFELKLRGKKEKKLLKKKQEESKEQSIHGDHTEDGEVTTVSLDPSEESHSNESTMSQGSAAARVPAVKLDQECRDETNVAMDVVWETRPTDYEEGDTIDEPVIDELYVSYSKKDRKKNKRKQHTIAETDELVDYGSMQTKGIATVWEDYVEHERS